ncbi:J517_1871 family lipoprotein [Ectopseudomonas oleovorans]|nr:J517_1871 family lipoprotein [Pseudomonas oleovorans]
MQRLLSATLAGILLTGCASPYDDLLKNEFIDVSATPVAPDYVGIWTGASGPFVMTLRIEPNGEGIGCTSSGTGDGRFLLRHRNGTIYFQSGGRVDLSREGDRLVATYPRYGMAQAVVQMVADDDLKNATPHCKDALAQK